MRGLRERRVENGRIAVGPVEHDVARALPRGSPVASLRSRAGDIRRARQFLVVDAHRLGRVLRLSQRLGDDNRDRLAHIPDAIVGKHRHRGSEHRLAVASRKHRNRRDRAEAVGAASLPL